MDSEKAKKFERHRKEMEKMAFLNVTVILLYLAGIGLYLGGFKNQFLLLLLAAPPTVIVSGMFVLAIIFLWALPVMHYREERRAVTNKDMDYYRGRDLADEPTIEILEEQGWKEVDSENNRVVLETFVSPFHRLIGRKTTLIMEKEEEGENSETYILKTRKNEINRTKTTYHERNGETIITETTVSLDRVSPIYLEITMFLEPDIEDLIEDLSEEDLKVTDEHVDVGIRRYELE
ncbi:MAG: hypothetical protein ABEJ87_04165 [Candidatus Nanohalobium sp.]